MRRSQMTRLPCPLRLCNHLSPPYLAHWGCEAGPAPSLQLSAASVARRRLSSYWRRLQLTPAAALVNRTALHAAIAAGLRACGRGLSYRDNWRGLRSLGVVGRVFGGRHQSVEGAVDRAVKRMRERVRKCEASGQQAADGRAHDGSALRRARGGKGRQLTRGRLSKKSSKFTSCCSRRLQDGVCGCTLKVAERDHVGLTSKRTR